MCVLADVDYDRATAEAGSEYAARIAAARAVFDRECAEAMREWRDATLGPARRRNAATA